MFNKPRAMPLEKFEQSSFWPLIAYGIVNPFGPTLMGIVTLHDEEDDRYYLVSFSLNPFNQDIAALAELHPGPDNSAIDHVLEAINRFDLRPDATPTLIIGTNCLNDEEILIVYEALLVNATNVVKTVNLCRSFLGNPWDRVSAETDDAWASVLRENHNDSRSGGHKTDDVKELLSIALSPEHLLEEVKAFSYAWKGSIDFQRSRGNGSLAQTALSTDRFAKLLVQILKGGPDPS